MKRLVGPLVVGVALLGSSFAAPASADTPGCVSHKEFRRVDVGDSRHRVHHVFDTRGGSIFSRGQREERAYSTCGGAVVFVTYADDRLTSKSWVRGE